jgi:hypothetical protein
MPQLPLTSPGVGRRGRLAPRVSLCIIFIFLVVALLSGCWADVQSVDPGLQGEYGSTPELTRHPTGTPPHHKS